MQSVAIYYVQPVTFYNFLYVFIFHLFQKYLKQFFRLVIYGFAENFKRYVLIKKDTILITAIIEEKS